MMFLYVSFVFTVLDMLTCKMKTKEQLRGFPLLLDSVLLSAAQVDVDSFPLLKTQWLFVRGLCGVHCAGLVVKLGFRVLLWL